MVLLNVRVIGHPFGPLGTSRAVRCSVAAFHAVGVPAKIIDVWQSSPPDPLHERTIAPHLARDFGYVNVFHLNGDEIVDVLEHLGDPPSDALNVVYPMWELPRYPEGWARDLERFDEVWAASKFIAGSITPSVSIPVVHMPLATQVALVNSRSRRYFGIEESHYTFLFLLDLRSYAVRKNPTAVIEAFERFLAARPWAQASLVIKLHGSANAPEARAELEERVHLMDRRILVIDRLMEEDEVHALVYNCDAFVSLHRSEGYGLGLAEAMTLGLPVIGTGFSGNLDFMNSEVAMLVSYRLVPVRAGEYPEWQGQKWADPDVEQAARLMAQLYDNPEGGRRLGRSASQHMATAFSFRAAGLRFLARVQHSLSSTGSREIISRL